VNNTPIVAVFIPMITDLAGRYDLSPSKLLLPLSYAAMLGGTLTLVGTATNILASDLSGQLLGHPLSMFEFTKLGVVISLGLAMQHTGGDALLAGVLVASTTVLPLIGVLALVFLLTSLLANVITPVATVVFMIPVAVDTAIRIDATPLTFLLAVMFAASTALMTPVGYQTNLMVYGPGGYRFTDYIRVGAPLQILVTVVTIIGLVVFWGL
jgi:di/tricarboxylate transporter